MKFYKDSGGIKVYTTNMDGKRLFVCKPTDVWLLHKPAKGGWVEIRNKKEATILNNGYKAMQDEEN